MIKVSCLPLSRVRPIAAALAYVVLVILIVSLSGCGAAGSRQVTITLPPSGLTSLNNAAPADAFAFYVVESSVPASASDLRGFSVYACTGESAGDRAIQIGRGLGLGNFKSITSESSTSCIQEALKTAKTIVVTQRGTALPSGAAVVELIFK
jgi:hypothetical protein